MAVGSGGGGASVGGGRDAAWVGGGGGGVGVSGGGVVSAWAVAARVARAAARVAWAAAVATPASARVGDGALLLVDAVGRSLRAATWRTTEFYITRKLVELAQENLTSQEVNKILSEMFEKEVPKDREVFTVVFRWFPNGPEYTLPPDMASGAVLYNERGARVQGELEEQLAKDLTLRANGGEYRSMILGFKREVPQGHRGSKVNILENTETITLELPRITKAGKPVRFTWKVKPDYPTRPLQMALLVDFPQDKYRIVW